MTTVQAADGIEDLRKCCGGNGYLLASGIGALADDYLWQTTAEGDFIILLNQTARFVIKHIDQTREGENENGLKGSLAHLSLLGEKSITRTELLSKLQSLKPPSFANVNEPGENLEKLLELFNYRSVTEVSFYYSKKINAVFIAL